MNYQYLFRTKEVLKENGDWLETRDDQIDDANEAVWNCADHVFAVTRTDSLRSMKKAIVNRFGPVARAIRNKKNGMVEVEYDMDKIESYISGLLSKFGNKANGVTIDDIKENYIRAYDIDGWADPDDEKGYIYDNISACTPFDTYMACQLMAKVSPVIDTFDAMFTIEDIGGNHNA